jgi:CSLREA domain-containing protein
MHVTFLCLLFLVIGSAPAGAVTFTVDSTQDEVDAAPGDGACATATGTCTLRAAIQEANALPGVDAIEVPAGTYTLAIPGQGEDAAATGDLDITGDVSIMGAGTASTIVDGNGLDRVFDTFNTVTLGSISGLTIQHGNPGPGGYGGGIYNSAIFTMSDVVITGNVADVNGGGIENDGDLTLIDVTVSGNMATVFGGGIDTALTFSASGLTVTGNTANAAGGVGNDAAATLTNVTVSGNTANVSGGGIKSDFNTTLTNVTLSNNTAPSGAGLDNLRDVTLASVIVANNPSTANCSGSGTLTSSGHNLDSGTTCGFTGPGDLVNVDPQLGPLQDNGGPTFTQALLAGSPAIDAGASDCPPPAADQRGGTRPVDGNSDGTAVCDIGAYEFGATLPSNTTSTTTTTTTLPSCPVEPTFTSIDCRLDALIGVLHTAVEPGPLRVGLENGLLKAKARSEQAKGAFDQGKTRRAKKGLGKARGGLGRFTARLHTRKARRQIPGDARASLEGAAVRLQSDIVVLRGSL